MKRTGKNSPGTPTSLPSNPKAGAPGAAQVLAELEASGAAASLDELIGRFGLSRLRDQEALARLLVDLARDGRLVQDRAGRYALAAVRSARVAAELAPEPAPLVPPPVAEREPPPRPAAKPAPRARDTAPPEESARVVGRLHVGDGGASVIPMIPRQTAVAVAKADRMGAKHGQVVVAERLPAPPGRAVSVGRIVEILGEEDLPGIEIEACIRAYDLPHEWPAAVEREARRLPGEIDTIEPEERREDLRELSLVTIDGADARDFDDAVACQPVKGARGWKLWVAIADVSSYVKPGAALDAEALSRGNSVYFPQRVIPMLPEVLSNGLCSLNPNVDRLCLVCEMRVDASGKVAKSRFYEAVMRSHARLTYEEVAALLEDDDSALAVSRPELVKPLHALDDVYQALLKARRERGAIDFESSETRIVFDEQRKIERLEPVTRTRAHRLIEECMIAANVEAARFAARHEVPILYRVHQRPDVEKIELLREFLGARGLHLRGGEAPQAGDFARLVEQLAGRPDAPLVQSVMLRSLMQARYATDNVGHFGLALEEYAHFTSPIRRYPDLLLHRAIKDIVARGSKAREGVPKNLEAQGVHCSMTERRADEATRDVVSWLKCEYMSHHVGEEFSGVVTAVVPFGLFVGLEGLFVEGLIHISRLGSDFFEYDPKRQRLVGSRSNKTYSLGEQLQVRVARVNVEERKIDLELSAAGQAAGGARTRRGPGRRRGR